MYCDCIHVLRFCTTHCDAIKTYFWRFEIENMRKDSQIQSSEHALRCLMVSTHNLSKFCIYLSPRMIHALLILCSSRQRLLPSIPSDLKFPMHRERPNGWLDRTAATPLVSFISSPVRLPAYSLQALITLKMESRHLASPPRLSPTGIHLLSTKSFANL